ncbi:GDSL-like Lipase/Acylhydrolase superfamily protein [Striga asiatica]|uniref:GDSL-like Lipase/Acylhydrolase superfamily protein n=1 Tax=Striga asiatica TaxID=4170 RepID=A0A5A7PGJ5_STRAF|nr:GDSL-like Lipase/Acylhydrolase superfamily protein [Striga asiatica]
MPPPRDRTLSSSAASRNLEPQFPGEKASEIVQPKAGNRRRRASVPTAEETKRDCRRLTLRDESSSPACNAPPRAFLRQQAIAARDSYRAAIGFNSEQQSPDRVIRRAAGTFPTNSGPFGPGREEKRVDPLPRAPNSLFSMSCYRAAARDLSTVSRGCPSSEPSLPFGSPDGGPAMMARGGWWLRDRDEGARSATAEGSGFAKEKSSRWRRARQRLLTRRVNEREIFYFSAEGDER